MKKTYNVPALEVLSAEVQTIIALSLKSDTKADPNEDVLVKENDWSVFE